MVDFNKEGFETRSVGTEEISESELKFGYWFVTHKEQIRKITIISLIIFSVLTYGYALFATVRYFAFRYDIHQAAINQAPVTLLNIQSIRNANPVQDIEVLSREVFSLGDGRVDIVAKVRNPNTRWALYNYTYQFALGSDLFEKEEAFLLPGEEKYIMELNVEGSSSVTPQVLIDDRQWKSVTLYGDWAPEYTDFSITDKQFIAPRQGEISGTLPVSEVSAVISNDTAYNYNEVEIQIALLSGSRLVAISKIPLQNFTSGQTRTVSTRFSQALSPVSTVEIIPSVNILDSSVYQDFEGEFDPAFFEFDARGRRL